MLYIKTDNNTAYVELFEICHDTGIEIEPRPEYVEEINSSAEKAGHTIIIRGRVLRIQTGLLKSLTNELYLTAIYLINWTPTEGNGWKTPFEIVTGKRPHMAHVHLIGSKAYTLNPHLARGDKIESRVLISHLVGFNASTIYRVWLPGGHRVVRTRDVIFEPRSGFKHEKIYGDMESSARVARVLDIDSDDDSDVQELDIEEVLRHAGPMEEEEEAIDQSADQLHQELLRAAREKDTDHSLPTPERTPTPRIESTASSRTVSIEPEEPVRLPKGFVLVAKEDVPNRRQNNAPKRIDPSISTSNIIKGGTYGLNP